MTPITPAQKDAIMVTAVVVVVVAYLAYSYKAEKDAKAFRKTLLDEYRLSTTKLGM